MYSRRDEVDSSTPIVVKRLMVARSFLQATLEKQSTSQRVTGYTVVSERVDLSTLVAAVITSLTIWRISTSAWRTTVAT